MITAETLAETLREEVAAHKASIQYHRRRMRVLVEQLVALGFPIYITHNGVEEDQSHGRPAGPANGREPGHRQD